MVDLRKGVKIPCEVCHDDLSALVPFIYVDNVYMRRWEDVARAAAAKAFSVTPAERSLADCRSTTAVGRSRARSDAALQPSLRDSRGGFSLSRYFTSLARCASSELLSPRESGPFVSKLSRQRETVKDWKTYGRRRREGSFCISCHFWWQENCLDFPIDSTAAVIKYKKILFLFLLDGALSRLFFHYYVFFYGKKSVFLTLDCKRFW